MVHIRPNIALAVGMVARFSTNPKENHMMEIKRIMRYLKGTKDYGLWYKKGGTLIWKPLLMLTSQDVLMTWKVLDVEHSFLERGYYLGQAKSRIAFFSQP